jgi:hypothetical protein
MSTLKIDAELPLDDDDDFGDVEARPLLGWLMMAVALVAMAFLVGGGGASASAPQNVTAAPPPATSVAAMVGEPSAAGVAFGG